MNLNEINGSVNDEIKEKREKINGKVVKVAYDICEEGNESEMCINVRKNVDME